MISLFRRYRLIAMAIITFAIPVIAVAGAVWTVSPTSFDFGTVTAGGSSLPHDFIFTNNGTDPVVPFLLSQPAQFTIDDSACQSNPLQPGDSCDVTVSYTPAVGSVGKDRATLTWSVNDIIKPHLSTAKVRLTGTAVAP